MKLEILLGMAYKAKRGASYRARETFAHCL